MYRLEPPSLPGSLAGYGLERRQASHRGMTITAAAQLIRQTQARRIQRRLQDRTPSVITNMMIMPLRDTPGRSPQAK